MISNDKPIIMNIDDRVYYPYIIDYAETDFGGELETTPDYKGYFITNLLENENNWAIFPINPHSYNSINYNNLNPNPAPPSNDNILGTDDRGVMYLLDLFMVLDFQLYCSSTYSNRYSYRFILWCHTRIFCRRIDLYLQRFIEIWGSMPDLYLNYFCLDI